MAVAELAGDTAVHCVVEDVFAKRWQERLGQGHFDLLPDARAFAVAQGRRDRKGSHHTGERIGGERVAGRVGRLVRVGADQVVADHPLYVRAEGAVVLVWPVEAVGRHAQHDQTRIHLLERLVGEPGALDRLGHVVLNEDIAVLDQAEERCAALG